MEPSFIPCPNCRKHRLYSVVPDPTTTWRVNDDVYEGVKVAYDRLEPQIACDACDFTEGYSTFAKRPETWRYYRLWQEAQAS